MKYAIRWRWQAIALLFISCLGLAAANSLEQGKTVAFARNKGNCLACHVIADGETPGNIGPPLVNMKQRFSDRKALRTKIWDATDTNPDTRIGIANKVRLLP